MNRRTFLRTTLQASAGAILATTALGACTRVPTAASRAIVGPGPFRLPALPYAPDALAPHIDALTMEIHHGKHHQGYINNVTAALETYPELQRKPLETLLEELNKLPADLQTAVRNHGGGHYNHSLFWQCLSPASTEPTKDLSEALTRDFGSREAFQQQFEAAGGRVFGSGWAWLVRATDGKLVITTSANQDNPLLPDAPVKGKPLFAIDVWEHAYYLNYQNRRPDYLKAIWQVTNWRFISERFFEV